MASAGVEPSPFFPDIGLIRDRLSLIGQSFTLPDSTQDSLDAIDERLARFAQDPQLNPWVTPELATKGSDVIDRISSILTNPQPDPALNESVAELIAIMDRISRILFDLQLEPPGHIALGFTIIDRISWVLFDPQTEPPGLPSDLEMQSIRVMYQVAGVIDQTSINGLLQGTIPGLNALEQLSGHLVDAVVRGKADKAAAQVNAMSQIAEQYANY